MKNNAEMIAELNDRLRRGECPCGEIRMTANVAMLGEKKVAALIKAIANFDNFTEDNDPHGERDMGFIDGFGSDRYIWKIDYYDQDFKMHSPDPADPRLTKRVLLIMEASEY